MKFFLSIQKKRPLPKLNAGVAWEQALRGALAAGREKEEELASTSLEFEYPHQKSRSEMLIGVGDISNDLITPRHVFFNVCLQSRSFPLRMIGGNLTAHSTGSHRGIGGGIQIPETQLQALLPFPAPPPERPGELVRKLMLGV